MIKNILLTAAMTLFFLQTTWASLGPRFESLNKKTGHYEKNGFFAGGTKEVTSAALSDVRRAKSNEGFERIVFDVTAQSDSLPYFQVQLSSAENRIVVSFWADVQYEYNAAKVAKAFSKSAFVKKINILPRVEEGLSMVEITMNPQSKAKAEVFTLSNPNRLIIDIL